MKVAHLTTVDSSLWYLLRPQLRGVLAAGGEVIGISAPGPWVAALESDGVRHLPLRSSTRGWDLLADVQAARDLWRILRRERVDVLHTHNPKPGVYGRIVGRLAGVPVVVNTNHGLYVGDDGGLRRLPVLALEAIAARCSDAELVQNPEDLALLTQVAVELPAPNPPARQWGRPAAVPAGGGPRRASGGPRRARCRRRPGGRRLRRPPRRREGPSRADRGRRPARATATSFVVIGPADPAKPDALTAEQVARGESAGVRFLGLRDDVDVLYRGMDLFVLPSHREGFPRAAMEAAASGLPTVATDIRGCRQVVADGVTGMLVPVRRADLLTAAIAELGENEPRRAAMGAAAVRKAESEFDETRVVDIVLETYRRGPTRRRLRRRQVTAPA